MGSISQQHKSSWTVDNSITNRHWDERERIRENKREYLGNELESLVYEIQIARQQRFDVTVGRQKEQAWWWSRHTQWEAVHLHCVVLRWFARVFIINGWLVVSHASSILVTFVDSQLQRSSYPMGSWSFLAVNFVRFISFSSLHQELVLRELWASFRFTSVLEHSVGHKDQSENEYFFQYSCYLIV